jgi:hypothetical protein
MSVVPWLPPAVAPHRGRFDREAGVLTLPDALALVTKPSAAPCIEDEAQLWMRPSASACFPVHPAGVVELHARAADLLADVLDGLELAEGDRDRVRRQLWQSACALYKPGAPVRSALDAFVEDGKYRPNLTGHDGAERIAATRTGLLAAWAVVRAATAWVAEA